MYVDSVICLGSWNNQTLPTLVPQGDLKHAYTNYFVPKVCVYRYSTYFGA